MYRSAHVRDVHLWLIGAALLVGCAHDDTTGLPSERRTLDDRIILTKSDGSSLYVPASGSGALQEVTELARRLLAVQINLRKPCSGTTVANAGLCIQRQEQAKLTLFSAVDMFDEGLQVMRSTSGGSLPAQNANSVERLMRAASSISNSTGQLRERVKTTLSRGEPGNFRYQYIPYKSKPQTCSGDGDWRTYLSGSTLLIGTYYFRVSTSESPSTCCEPVAVWDDPSTIAACAGVRLR